MTNDHWRDLPSEQLMHAVTPASSATPARVTAVIFWVIVVALVVARALAQI